MGKDDNQWEFRKGEHHPRRGVNVEPIKNLILLTSLYVLNVTNLYSLTISVLIVEPIKGERSSRR
jgi:hypothetical protein